MVLSALLIVEERLHLLLVADAGALPGLLERRLLAEDLERRPQLLVLVVVAPSGVEPPCGVHVEAERRLIVILLEGAVLQLSAPGVSPCEEFVKVGGVNLG